MAETQNTIESSKDFERSPQGQAQRWSTEMQAADKEVEAWHREGQKVVDRFLDKRSSATAGATGSAVDRSGQSRLNIFTSNIQTVRAMMYGQTPSVDVKRRYNEQGDDAARVAGTILERLLNTHLEEEDDPYCEVLRYCLDDRLLPGLGVARVRYEREEEEVEVEAIVAEDGTVMAEGYTETRLVDEQAPVDYVFWKDVRWSPARVWGEVRWVAFGEDLTRDQVLSRFGEEMARKVESAYTNERPADETDSTHYDAWQRVRVWEVWSLEDRRVYWWVAGVDTILDEKDDFLQLTGFFPCPRFLAANLTTSSLVPRPDFVLWRDLYNEIDFISTRIERLERSIKAAGVYDAASAGVKRLMEETLINELIPVENWASFLEKGGLRGSIEWMPIEALTGALTVLRDYRRELIDLLYQVTGLSDILRGASTQPNVTATEQGLKARYASVRITCMQEEFASFASDLQRLRAEVMVNHFSPQTIVERSGIMQSVDAPLVPDAMGVLKGEMARYRVKIRPDSIARADYAALRNERGEYLIAVGTFLERALGLAQTVPQAAPALVEMVKWASAGFRAGDELETVLDQLMSTLQQQGQGQGQGQQNPEVVKAQARMREQQQKAASRMAEIQASAQAKMAEIRAEAQADMVKAQQELQIDQQREWNQTRANVTEEQAKAEIRTREAAAKMAMGGGA